jgi:3'(2'), 5'-bisphosphate nucleotidase
MSNLNLPHEWMTALEAARQASQEVMQVYAGEFDAIIKQDGSPVTEADLRSSRVINEILAQTGIPVIGEELKNKPFGIRKNWETCWIVDPVDGTKEFIKRNGEFAINIALAHQGEAIFGLIVEPVRDYLFFGGKSHGLFELDFSQHVEPKSWNKQNTSVFPIKLATSRSHESGEMDNYIAELSAQFGNPEFIKKGSALKFIDLVKQDVHAYPRFAPTMEWDVAAGQAILEAAGGRVIHANTGEPLRYNKENLLNPHFIAEHLPRLNA